MSVRSVLILMAAAAVLSSCSQNDDTPEPNNALEQAAAERGLIDTELAEPMGIFERRKGAARERLCVAHESGGTWRFAAELSAGPGASCLTGGQLQVSEAKAEEDGSQVQSWKMRLRGLDGCEIEAVAQGSSLTMPDHLPAACSKLCAGRSEIGGAELERTSWAEEEALALRLRGADASIWTECGLKKAS